MKKTLLLGIALTTLLGAAQALGAEATENWGKHCASCHGKDGTGQTKAGRLIKAKDLTDGSYQKSFTDDEAVKATLDGMQDKDGKTQMKPFKDKISDDEAKALIAYVRTLAK